MSEHEAVAAVGGSHSHWREGGAGGICRTCERGRERATDLRDRLDAVAAALSTGTATEKCPDCGHVHTPTGCGGEPTSSDRWAGVNPAVCDCPGTATRDGAVVKAEALEEAADAAPPREFGEPARIWLRERARTLRAAALSEQPTPEAGDQR